MASYPLACSLSRGRSGTSHATARGPAAVARGAELSRRFSYPVSPDVLARAKLPNDLTDAKDRAAAVTRNAAVAEGWRSVRSKLNGSAAETVNGTVSAHRLPGMHPAWCGVVWCGHGRA